jgi:5-hydroxyisourate hydrolase
MISTHILDTSLGMPAANVEIQLEKKDQKNNWIKLGSGKTNDDGRLVFDCEKVPGDFRLLFQVEKYYQEKNIDFFFLDTEIVFRIENTNRNYHVPMLLNPYGYTTYRGS